MIFSFSFCIQLCASVYRNSIILNLMIILLSIISITKATTLTHMLENLKRTKWHHNIHSQNEFYLRWLLIFLSSLKILNSPFRKCQSGPLFKSILSFYEVTLLMWYISMTPSHIQTCIHLHMYSSFPDLILGHSAYNVRNNIKYNILHLPTAS